MPLTVVAMASFSSASFSLATGALHGDCQRALRQHAGEMALESGARMHGAERLDLALRFAAGGADLFVTNACADQHLCRARGEHRCRACAAIGEARSRALAVGIERDGA